MTQLLMSPPTDPVEQILEGLEDPIAYRIGWDHAQHGLDLPPALQDEASPVLAGWRAGRACFSARTLGASRCVRQWLQLRLHAWRRGRVFDLGELTPHYLGQLEVAECPITRQPLAGGEATLDRVCDAAAHAAGNLAMISRSANQAKGSLDFAGAMRRARLAAEHGPIDGLDAAAWMRVAVLISFVTPLPHEQAARLPLLLLPPNRLRLLNPVQGLQALVTRELARADGPRRLRSLGALLPDEAQRLDFSLYLAALLPRLIEAGAAGAGGAGRHALEDAWADDRVNRCWQRFALALDEPLVDRLLQHCASAGLAGTHTLLHERERATEGWALPAQGRIDAPVERRRRPLRAGGARGIRARMPLPPSLNNNGHLPAR